LDQEKQAGGSVEELTRPDRRQENGFRPSGLFSLQHGAFSMKHRLFSVLFALFTLLTLSAALPVHAQGLSAAPPVHAQGGFVDKPGSAMAGVITVVEAKKLRDDTYVQLQGVIVRALGDEKYMFRDSSGEIVVEIDDDVWRGVTVSPDDGVEIRGEIDKDILGISVEIEVEAIKKL
jgi:uncharacterized protein (TIGR00156 family)